MIAAGASAPFAAGEPGVLAAAVGWLSGTVTGTIAAGLCVLAVAAVGLMMLAGRLPVREGLRVVLGCFVLLGAPAIAAGLMGLGQSAGGPGPPPPVVSEPGAPRAPLAPTGAVVVPQAEPEPS